MICVYPGSFDPVTRGHMDVISRAARLFDEVLVAALINAEKKGRFSGEEKLEMLTLACADMKNVRVLAFSGLLVDFCRENGARAVVRGVRGSADLESESMMARANQMLLPGLETILLPANPACAQISSTLVWQVLEMGGDARPFLPEQILPVIERHYRR